VSDTIILCEPQFRGFEHATFNAALVASVLRAWPEIEVTFMSEGEHAGQVRGILSEAMAGASDHVHWHGLRNVPRSASHKCRIGLEASCCTNALRLAKRTGARALVFCSLTNTLLLVLRTMIGMLGVKNPVLAIPHDILNTLTDKLPGAPCRRLVSLQRLLRGKLPVNLRLIALGDFIYRNIESLDENMARHFSAVNPPFIWAESSPPQSAPDMPLRFGYFGVSSRGFDQFVDLAREVHAERPSACEFIMVGFLNRPEDEGLLEAAGDAVKGISRTPLSRAEYAERGRALTYAVWMAPPELYRFRTSTAFLDGMSFLKPGVYLANDCLEHYVHDMGDVGYLCKDRKEMKETILSFIDSFPADRYVRQCERIHQRREMFSPAVVGEALKKVVEEVQ
jgi:hypothetical protein